MIRVLWTLPLTRLVGVVANKLRYKCCLSCGVLICGQGNNVLTYGNVPLNGSPGIPECIRIEP
jgi:hypothetical protein